MFMYITIAFLFSYLFTKSRKLQISTDGETGNMFWMSVEPKFLVKEMFVSNSASEVNGA